MLMYNTKNNNQFTVFQSSTFSLKANLEREIIDCVFPLSPQTLINKPWHCTIMHLNVWIRLYIYAISSKSYCISINNNIYCLWEKLGVSCHVLLRFVNHHLATIFYRPVIHLIRITVDPHCATIKSKPATGWTRQVISCSTTVWSTRKIWQRWYFCS